MGKGKKLAKNTVVLGVGQLIPKALAVVTLPILTKAFSTGEFGIYDLIISFSSLILPLMTLLVQQAVFRNLIDDETAESRKTNISNALWIISRLSLAYFVLLLVVGFCFKLDILLLISAFFLYFFDCIYDLMGQISRGIGKNSWYSIASVIYSITNVGILVASYFFNLLDINTALVIIGISYFVASLYLIVKNKIWSYYDRKTISKKTMKKMLAYSVPIIPSSISLWAVNLSDRLILTTFLGSSANGIYAASCKIPNMYATVFNIFNLAWTEHASRYLKEQDSKEHYSNLLNNLICFMVGVMLILMVCSRWFFSVLIDSKFWEGYVQLPILYISVFVSCLVSFYGGLYIAYKNTKKVGYSSFAGAVINIVINLLFVKTLGIFAASISTLVSFVIILLYRVIDVRKYIKIDYSLFKIVASLLCLILSVALFYMSDNYVFLIANIVLAIIYNLIFNRYLTSAFKRGKH